MLHKESAQICEEHFAFDDMIVHNTKKTLKIGAMPKKKLPKQIISSGITVSANNLFHDNIVFGFIDLILYIF